MSLTATEYEMLALLIEHAGRIVSRDEMFRVVFGRESSVFDRALDVHLSHLRAKMGARRSLILTIRGAGHLLRIDSNESPEPFTNLHERAAADGQSMA